MLKRQRKWKWSAIQLAGVGAVLLSPMASAQTPGTLVTFAGGGDTVAKKGDSIPAAQARLIQPTGVMVDPQGNVYLADEEQHSVFKVNADGFLERFAGVGTRGYTGDKGPALDARMAYPQDLAINSEGVIHIADLGNSRIRCVDATGVMTTCAGNGGISLSLPYGIALDAEDNLLIADMPNRVLKVDREGVHSRIVGQGSAYNISGQWYDADGTLSPPFEGDGGPAIEARLWFSTGGNENKMGGRLAVDAKGDLYISDYLNHRIRKVEAKTGIITTYAGNGEAGSAPYGDGGPVAEASIKNPEGLAIDSAGNLFVADQNRRIRKISPDGVITTVAGGGSLTGPEAEGAPATDASLSMPVGMVIDRDGNLLFTDFEQGRVYKVFGVAAPGLLNGKPFPNPSVATGDLNGNGSVEIADATLALQVSLQLATLTPQQVQAGDLIADGKIDIKDVTLILRKAVGL